MVAIEKQMAKTDLSSEEVKRRVAILKRFRELLCQQRDRFRQYLTVLDKQKEVIENGDTEQLIAHVELEEQIVGDIFAIQKVIDPLEAMYQVAFPAGSAVVVGTASAAAVGNSGAGTLPGFNRVNGPVTLQGDVPDLRAALEELRSEAVIRSGRNKDLLAKRMEELRQEMRTLRSNPYAIHRPSYSDNSAVLVDIAG